jgi:hypothetical protein
MHVNEWYFKNSPATASIFPPGTPPRGIDLCFHTGSLQGEPKALERGLFTTDQDQKGVWQDFLHVFIPCRNG